MCDIYNHQCDHEDCANHIEMHLADYETSRQEIAVFCGTHIPQDRSNGVLWRYKPSSQKATSKMFVQCLTKNAKSHWEGNCFNGECWPVEIFGKQQV